MSQKNAPNLFSAFYFRVAGTTTNRRLADIVSLITQIYV